MSSTSSSWADVAKQNRLPEDQQPKPDPNLLEGGSDSTESLHSTGGNEKVSVISAEEFAVEKAALEDAERSDEPIPHHDDHAKILSEKDAPAALLKPKPAAPAASSGSGQSSSSTSKQAVPSKKDLSKDAKAAKNEVLEELEHSEKTLADSASSAGKKAEDAAASAGKKAEDAASSAGKKAGDTFDKLKASAKEDYDTLSEKAKAAYDRLSKEGKEDWHKLSKESKKRWDDARNSDIGKEVQKPEVWGSMLGVANLALIGTVGYYAYANWHRPRWDRRVVSATVISVAAWFGLQGYLIPQTDAVKSKRT